MGSSPGNDSSNWYSYSSDHQIDSKLHFWMFLIADVFGLICTVFVLYPLVAERQLRKALHNHVLIIILFLVLLYELIDIPLHLQFLSTGIVRPSTPTLCLIWWFIDWGNYYTITVLLVFASIERHILIFHCQMVATKRKRLIFHYGPLFMILLFMVTFYSIAIFAPICDSTFDYTSDLCGTHACYGTIPFLALVEQVGFGTISSCLIAIFSMALLVRVVRQKYRVHRIVQWKRQRKLAVQMIALSLLYLTFSLPITIIYIVRLSGQSDWADNVVSLFFFLSYFAILFLPYVCLGNLPGLWNRLKNCDPRQRQRVAVVPIH
jgi:hypothetical protein